MRVIAGKYGGRPIRTPKGLAVRPTTDRTREALFNILNNYVEWEKLSVLELFCGTAAVSLEFISRGVSQLVCVDQNGRCVKAAKKLFSDFGVKEAKVQQMKAEIFVKKSTKRFDLIFMDPPYAMEGQPLLLARIFDRQLLCEGGMLILEHESQQQFEEIPYFDFSRKYGNSSLSFFIFHKNK